MSNRFQSSLLCLALLLAGCAVKPITSPPHSASLRVSLGTGRQLQTLPEDIASASIRVKMAGYDQTMPFELNGGEKQPVADFSGLRDGDAEVCASVYGTNNQLIGSGVVFTPIQLGGRNSVTVAIQLSSEGRTTFMPLNPITSIPPTGTILQPSDAFWRIYRPKNIQGMKWIYSNTDSRYDPWENTEEITQVQDGIYTLQTTYSDIEDVDTATGSIDLFDYPSNKTYKVIGPETLSVSAGTYDTVKIEVTDSNSDDIATIWYAKGVGAVKMTETWTLVSEDDWNGQRITHTEELKSFYQPGVAVAKVISPHFRTIDHPSIHRKAPSSLR